MQDFFVSYTSADKKWAEWVAYVLEEAGFEVIIQAWDFRPGENFPLKMQRAATECDRTLAILSPDYLGSRFGSAEWAAAFASDPEGIRRKLVPVLVRACEPPGLLRGIIHIDLVEVDEDEAIQRLSEGVQSNRLKPARRPPFPGGSTGRRPAPFPGKPGRATNAAEQQVYLPKVAQPVTDLDRKRFIRGAFNSIRGYFASGLTQISSSQPQMETDIFEESATAFSAEIFLNGTSLSKCRIWIGGLSSSNGISFAEGSTADIGSGASNEILSPEQSNGELVLKALLAMGSLVRGAAFDTDKMTPEQAAEYLWRRFVAPLERRR